MTEERRAFEDDEGFLGPSRQFVEAASWRVACELMRRHSRRMRLIETHPGGGQADCLSFYDRATTTHILDLNRRGGAHGGERSLSREDVWWALASLQDPKVVVDAVEEMAGIKTAGSIPEETAEVVTYRFIAELLVGRVLGRQHWECRSGYNDSSGGGGGPRIAFASAFPAMEPRWLVRMDDDLLGLPAYRFWFLLCDGAPLVALEPRTGTAWNIAGETFDLLKCFQGERRINPLIPLVARNWLS